MLFRSTGFFFFGVRVSLYSLAEAFGIILESYSQSIKDRQDLRAARYGSFDTAPTGVRHCNAEG